MYPIASPVTESGRGRRQHAREQEKFIPGAVLIRFARPTKAGGISSHALASKGGEGYFEVV